MNIFEWLLKGSNIQITPCYENGHKKISLYPNATKKDTLISALLRSGPHTGKWTLFWEFRYTHCHECRSSIHHGNTGMLARTWDHRLADSESLNKAWFYTSWGLSIITHMLKIVKSQNSLTSPDPRQKFEKKSWNSMTFQRKKKKPWFSLTVGTLQSGLAIWALAPPGISPWCVSPN